MYRLVLVLIFLNFSCQLKLKNAVIQESQGKKSEALAIYQEACQSQNVWGCLHQVLLSEALKKYAGSERAYTDLCQTYNFPEACVLAGGQAQQENKIDIAVKYFKQACTQGLFSACLLAGRQDESLQHFHLAKQSFDAGCKGGHDESCKGLLLRLHKLKILVEPNVLQIDDYRFAAPFLAEQLFASFGQTTETKADRFRFVKQFGWTRIGVQVETDTEVKVAKSIKIKMPSVMAETNAKKGVFPPVVLAGIVLSSVGSLEQWAEKFVKAG